jgi:hypothetical protein
MNVGIDGKESSPNEISHCDEEGDARGRCSLLDILCTISLTYITSCQLHSVTIARVDVQKSLRQLLQRSLKRSAELSGRSPLQPMLSLQRVSSPPYPFDPSDGSMILRIRVSSKPPFLPSPNKLANTTRNERALHREVPEQRDDPWRAASNEQAYHRYRTDWIRPVSLQQIPHRAIQKSQRWDHRCGRDTHGVPVSSNSRDRQETDG